MDIFEELVENGWREAATRDYPDAAAERTFCKIVFTQGKSNGDRCPLFSIKAIWIRWPDRTEHWQLSLEARSQTPGVWLTCHTYYLRTENFSKVWRDEVARLIRCWKAANQETTPEHRAESDRP